MFNSTKQQQAKQHELTAANILLKQKKISSPKAKTTPEEKDKRQGSDPLEKDSFDGGGDCDHCRDEYMKLTKAKLQEICIEKELAFDKSDNKTLLVDKLLGE